MRPLSTLFTEQDREAINRAVQEAESKTSAEIVPVVAASSGRYDRPEDIIGLWFALAAMAAVWFAYPLQQEQPGSWGHAHPAWQLAALLTASVCGFIVGIWIGNRVDGFRRLFTPRAQMQEEVWSRARAVFHDQRVHHTAGSSGVLLYVSMFERMAAIIADQTVLRALGQTKLDELCAEFIRRLHTTRTATAIQATILNVGDALKPALPQTEGDANELPDALQLLEDS